MARSKLKTSIALLKIILLLICVLLLMGAICIVVLLEHPDAVTVPPTESAVAQPVQQTEPEATKQGLLQQLLEALKKDRQETSTDGRVEAIEKTAFGIDVARYQGTIDWEKVAAAGVEFAMVRVGYRTLEDGIITADPNARYNMQEASNYGIQLGVYFFSTAISEAEAKEEAQWVADFIARYPITYPVAYNCEGFDEPENRQHTLGKTRRTDLALVFLETIEQLGYEGMFYASKNEMEADAQWAVSRIAPNYKIWVAQYPEQPYPQTAASSYSGAHQMWQYSRTGTVDGIDGTVDINLAYFGYAASAAPKDDTPAATVQPDAEARMSFEAADAIVTAKSETNLRDIPSQGTDAMIVHRLLNGEQAHMVGISESGWAKVEYNGMTLYAVASYLTTDLSTPVPTQADERVQTVFESVSENVTAKDVVNLRTLPSVTDAEVQVVAQLKNGEIVRRTGINRDLGWSRVEYQGQILYCVSSYLELVP